MPDAENPEDNFILFTVWARTESRALVKARNRIGDNFDGRVRPADAPF